MKLETVIKTTIISAGLLSSTGCIGRTLTPSFLPYLSLQQTEEYMTYEEKKRLEEARESYNPLIKMINYLENFQIAIQFPPIRSGKKD